MAKTLAQLKVEATEAAEFRGHKVEWEDSITDDSVSVGFCKCGEMVTVQRFPLPNEIDIGGTAVALNCTG